MEAAAGLPVLVAASTMRTDGQTDRQTDGRRSSGHPGARTQFLGKSCLARGKTASDSTRGEKEFDAQSKFYKSTVLQHLGFLALTLTSIVFFFSFFIFIFLCFAFL